ncbi:MULTISPECIES: DNA-binding transcriptional regulator Fis [Oceanospirillaceae]|jgi:Fis family transcriptional regulator|uniref:Putative Fis-like DNA-binding protein n=1 Tax=Thalassolituus hydrocarboniclasticus TaxID=2742796 RepID=A0ABY6A7R9_9GAMM|nr:MULTISPECIES: DNA-binding transcriptional regulator Fis [Thalassolituus]MAY14052.1 DNA-binding transcriptional regulator Fis [Oceanospirillaceae bacterium]MBU2038485.1 DNA-binding transcriptional regulator Fis [Gammaproteobacteria bacterium]MCD8523702.1 DNA-binding transcriptional regulator Fis [Saccharospirillaceae bacterium]PIQ39880.1 MAG: DNA-binding transcriptional regulator Fis [Thalassolituus sp. CG17_big_fil_post_rev_8_21_14_2_50_53_8]MCA6060319.1 DNA-binding transcriptional regulato|tara:strand:+ start:398 stop:730 length:333 start_codon:yes stop_codon:yes gene_type:complete
MNTDTLNSEVIERRKVETVTDSADLQQYLRTPLEATQTLRDSVEKALQNYFDHLDGQAVVDIYDMVLSEVEAPLLETVMKYTRDNQTKASVVLGLNRGTLRKKLKQYGML